MKRYYKLHIKNTKNEVSMKKLPQLLYIAHNNNSNNNNNNNNNRIYLKYIQYFTLPLHFEMCALGKCVYGLMLLFVLWNINRVDLFFYVMFVLATLPVW